MKINIVFDGPPSPTAGRFVEIEDTDGRSISVGTWEQRPDGLWNLALDTDALLSLMKNAILEDMQARIGPVITAPPEQVLGEKLLGRRVRLNDEIETLYGRKEAGTEMTIIGAAYFDDPRNPERGRTTTVDLQSAKGETIFRRVPRGRVELLPDESFTGISG